MRRQPSSSGDPEAGTKYGADFRVYDKGVKPKSGQREEWEHAKFIVWVVEGDKSLEASTLVGMNRVAHSVKKLLWLAVIDKDLDITYVQMSRPGV